MKAAPRLQSILTLSLLAAGLAVARESVSPPRSAAADPPRLEFTARQLEYGFDSSWVELKGDVTVIYGDERLQADYVRVNRDTKEAQAFGDVRLERPQGEWTGKSLTYNFETGEGSAKDVKGHYEPFFLEWESAERAGGETNVLYDAKITTCTNAAHHWHYHVRAGKAEVVAGDYVKARNAVFYLGPVPVFYLPYWYRDLDGVVGYRFYPGYDSRMGAFLLSSVRYPFNPILRGETHVDLRSRRGVALGQDFKWRASDASDGELSLYWLQDQNPVDDDEDETDDIDEQRYRLYLDHRHDFSARDYLLMQVEYVSDTDMREDFFEDAYRARRQPENYFVYTHRGDRYTAGMAVRGRINDFYESVNRIPELSYDLYRRPLGQSGVYYESKTTAAGLQRAFAEGSGLEDYSSFRLDTDHLVNRPSKHLGFLTLVPRVGYRGTYYSKTRDTVTSTNTFLALTTNVTVDAGGNTNVAVVSEETTEVSTETIETGGELRSRVELGLEASFKAFRQWDGPAGPRRHVVEPYANYTFVPEPTLLPERIYQFDRVDRLDEEHFVKVGVRNKLQVKRGSRPYDLIDLDVFTRLRLEREDDEDLLGDIQVDAELRPWTWLAVDLDARYDTGLSALTEFNAWMRFGDAGPWSGTLDYRFLDEESSLLAAAVTYDPVRAWTYGLMARYEFEESRLEETGGFIQRTFDCMAIKTGVSYMPGYTRSDGTERDADVRALVELWVTAFPHISLAAGHKN